jgi:N4-gp56 family major capsid protein
VAYITGQASLLKGNLSHYPAAHYVKRALDQLWKKFRFRDPLMLAQMPQNEGYVIQWHRYDTLSANTTARTISGSVTEGAIGTPITLSNGTVQATLGQYTDFIAISDFVTKTAIDNVTKAAADNLGYRGGLSVDTITRTEIDSASGAVVTTQGEFFRNVDADHAATQLRAADVETMSDGTFFGIMSPYVEFDFVNDPAAGGYADLQKYSRPEKLEKVDGDLIGIYRGVKFFRSNNVKVTDATPDTYRVYVFGKDGVGGVDLAGNGPASVKDPKRQAFNVKVRKFNGEIEKADPEGVIGSIVSYNYFWTSKILDTNYRFRMFDAKSSLITS